MVPARPAGKTRRRATVQDGVQERGGEGRKKRARRSQSRQHCRGRSRHLLSVRPPSLLPARDETNAGAGKGERIAGGRALQQQVPHLLRTQAGGLHHTLTSASPYQRLEKWFCPSLRPAQLWLSLEATPRAVTKRRGVRGRWARPAAARGAVSGCAGRVLWGRALRPAPRTGSLLFLVLPLLSPHRPWCALGLGGHVLMFLSPQG